MGSNAKTSVGRHKTMEVWIYLYWCSRHTIWYKQSNQKHGDFDTLATVNKEQLQELIRNKDNCNTPRSIDTSVKIFQGIFGIKRLASRLQERMACYSTLYTSLHSHDSTSNYYAKVQHEMECSTSLEALKPENGFEKNFRKHYWTF